jgi:hypothetical protein
MNNVVENEVVCLTVRAFNEWVELLKELGYKFGVRNESDYSGFQARIIYDEPVVVKN